MRKKIYILAAIALISLVGCGNNTAAEDVRNTTSTTSATSVEKTSEKVSETTTQSSSQKVDNKQPTTKQSEKENVEKIDLSGINPYAVKEIQNMLDSIDASISVNDKVFDNNVIKQTVDIMAMSVGNSLVENQVKLVAADWKQSNAGNISDFKKKFDIVYGEYEVLSTSKAENELKKINLTLDGHEYCGSGKLDMMEWLNTYIR